MDKAITIAHSLQGEFEQKKEEEQATDKDDLSTSGTTISTQSLKSPLTSYRIDKDDGQDANKSKSEDENEWEEMDKKQGYELALFTGFRDEIGIASGIIEGKLYRRTINART